MTGRYRTAALWFLVLFLIVLLCLVRQNGPPRAGGADVPFFLNI